MNQAITSDSSRFSWNNAANFMTRRAGLTTFAIATAATVALAYAQQPVVQGIAAGTALANIVATICGNAGAEDPLKFNDAKSLKTYRNMSIVFAGLASAFAILVTPLNRHDAEARVLNNQIDAIENNHPVIGFQQESFPLPSGQSVSIKLNKEIITRSPQVTVQVVNGQIKTLDGAQCPATAVYTVTGKRIVNTPNTSSLRNFLAGTNVLANQSEDFERPRMDSCPPASGTPQALAR